MLNAPFDNPHCHLTQYVSNIHRTLVRCRETNHALWALGRAHRRPRHGKGIARCAEVNYVTLAEAAAKAPFVGGNREIERFSV